MITVNMHEAKTRLSQLVEAVERDNEEVLICRNGKAAARLLRVEKKKIRRDRLKPDPRLKVKVAKGYNPTEPLSEDEWPAALR